MQPNKTGDHYDTLCCYRLNNNYLCVIDGKDKRLLEAKFDNDANLVIQALKPFKRRLMAVAIESTFNWYWLADALIEAGFEVMKD